MKQGWRLPGWAQCLSVMVLARQEELKEGEGSRLNVIVEKVAVNFCWRLWILIIYMYGL